MLTWPKTSPGNAGWDNVEALLLQGLAEVKESLISFCEAIIWGMEPSPDLVPLHSHETTLPISLRSFDDDLLSGIKLTSHSRYDGWFSRSFRRGKRPRAGEGSENPKKPKRT